MRINIEDLKTAGVDRGVIEMEHTKYLRDVLTTLKVLTFFIILYSWLLVSGAQFLSGVSCLKIMWNIILVYQITHGKVLDMKKNVVVSSVRDW